MMLKSEKVIVMFLEKVFILVSAKNKSKWKQDLF